MSVKEYARVDCMSLLIFTPYTQYKNTHPLPVLSLPLLSPQKKKNRGKIESTEFLKLCEFFQKKAVYENQKIFMNKLFYGKHQLE